MEGDEAVGRSTSSAAPCCWPRAHRLEDSVVCANGGLQLAMAQPQQQLGCGRPLFMARLASVLTERHLRHRASVRVDGVEERLPTILLNARKI